MEINHTKFFSEYRQEFGRLRQGMVTGLELLGRQMAEDSQIKNIRSAAYMLATVKHECADRWHPITEFGKKSYFDKYEPGTSIGRRLGNTEKGDGWRYRGRGYVQITGRANYKRLSDELNLPEEENLIDHPENTLVPAVAYGIMSVGMRKGLFTGKKLSDYFNSSKTDYLNARRIINGRDQWRLIRDYAQAFDRILRASLIQKGA
ncbi:MAG: hypothetical protein AAF431_16925 [Pseudomonadota bacterium]